LSSNNSILNKKGSNPTISFSELRDLVSSKLRIVDAYIDINGTPTFIIFPENLKEKFEKLVFRVYEFGLIPILRMENNNLILRFREAPPTKRIKRARNILLFFVTLITIFIAGYFLWTTNELWSSILMPRANPFGQAAIFSICLISIIGLHEMGHKLACSFHRIRSTLPYFIPGPPPFGTFGAVISLKNPPINRNQLFDLGISGPIAGLTVTIIVCVFSVLTGKIVPDVQLAELEGMVSPVSWPSSPLLFMAIFQIIESFNIMHVPQGATLILAQTFLAAWVGALLTFLNTMPVWQLDGGHVARAVLGPKGHRMASIVGLGILALSGYWFFALFILFFMMFSRRSLTGAEPLDDVTPLSKSRKISYFILLSIPVICFVIPPL
jgi:membrane-associated protease RseP (regulator of RpoE activity)